MDFILKKIISFFLMPVSVGLMLCLITLYFLFSSKIRKAKFFLSLTFIWFFLISFVPFSNALIKPLEDTYPRIGNEINNAQYVLLLGGNFQERAYEVLRLYEKIENLKIITSGYGGAKTISDAQESKEKLIELGVKEENIITQPLPKDTRQEAIAVKTIVGNEPLILVTSAIHMPRAMMLFKNEGVNVIAAPTGFLYNKDVSFYHLIGSSSNTQKAIHEYLGILYTKFQSFKKSI